MDIHWLAKHSQGPAQFHLGPVYVRIARHDDDRNVREFRLTLQAVHHKFASSCRKVKVQKDEVRGLTPGHAHRDGAIGSFEGLIPALAQDGRNPETAIFMVFDDEDFFHRNTVKGGKTKSRRKLSLNY